MLRNFSLAPGSTMTFVNRFDIGETSIKFVGGLLRHSFIKDDSVWVTDSFWGVMSNRTQEVFLQLDGVFCIPRSRPGFRPVAWRPAGQIRVTNGVHWRRASRFSTGIPV